MRQWVVKGNEDQVGWHMLKCSLNQKAFHTLFLTKLGGEESAREERRSWQLHCEMKINQKKKKSWGTSRQQPWRHTNILEVRMSLASQGIERSSSWLYGSFFSVLPHFRLSFICNHSKYVGSGTFFYWHINYISNNSRVHNVF